MKQVYVLLSIILIGVVLLNGMILYTMQTRPTTEQVQKLVDEQSKLDVSEAVAARVQKVLSEIPTPSPVPTPKPGPKGDKGDSIVGPPGKDGLSITGPKGDPGAPGREIELARDPLTGDLFMRYTGDTAWTLVEAPNAN